MAESQNTPGAHATRRLMELERQSSAGQFHILDARLVAGSGDAAPYAENWALASARTPHSFEAAAGGKATALGELRWMRFSITLWLPDAWKAPGSFMGRGRLVRSEVRDQGSEIRDRRQENRKPGTEDRKQARTSGFAAHRSLTAEETDP